MKRDLADPPSKTLTLPLMAALCALALSAACDQGARNAGPATGADLADSATGPLAGPREDETGPRVAVPGDVPAPPVPRVSWPRGWRLVDSGSFGTPDDAVSWYRLEGAAGEPGEAARELLLAVEPLVGARAAPPHLASVMPTGSGADEAVAQVEGALSRAGIHVRRERGLLVALVLLHPPGA